MVFSPLDSMLLGGLAVNALTSMSNALPPPKKDGWYSFFFNSLRSFTSGIVIAYQQKFHLNVPDSAGRQSPPAMEAADSSPKS